MTTLRQQVEALTERFILWDEVASMHTAIFARDDVLALIPEGSVLVTEESLAAALGVEMVKGLPWFYMGHVRGDLTLDDWRACAAAILARLREDEAADRP